VSGARLINKKRHNYWGPRFISSSEEKRGAKWGRLVPAPISAKLVRAAGEGCALPPVHEKSDGTRSAEGGRGKSNLSLSFPLRVTHDTGQLGRGINSLAFAFSLAFSKSFLVTG